MRNPFAPGVGGVLSADIAVPEHEREFSFYVRILTTGTAPLWRDDLTNSRGATVIGLGARSPEHDVLPLQWMPHVQVLDIDVSVARALELGGRELMHADRDDGRRQWAVLADPTGAAFGLIPIVNEETASMAAPERTGRISWMTLAVPDVATACEFYEQVVGWSRAPVAIDSGFEMRRPNGVAAAEIRRAGGDLEGIPSVWILSLPVSDIEVSLRRVREGDGEVVKGPTDQGQAVIRDPVGVYIALQAET